MCLYEWRVFDISKDLNISIWICFTASQRSLCVCVCGNVCVWEVSGDVFGVREERGGEGVEDRGHTHTHSANCVCVRACVCAAGQVFQQTDDFCDRIDLREEVRANPASICV